MKGKLEFSRKKKTITLIATIIILLGIAATGVTLFLKDEGSASAIEMDGNQAQNVNSTSNGELVENQNQEQTENTEANVETNNQESSDSGSTNQQTNSEGQTTNTQGTGTTGSQSTTSSDRTQISQTTQPQEYILYRDRLVAEDFLVGWTPIAISAIADTTNKNLYTPELEILKNSYTEADIIEQEGEIIFPEETKYTYTRSGERVFYEIKVRNVDNFDVKNIRVTDTVPEDTTLAEVSDDAKVEENKITWLVDIPSKTEVTLRFIVTVNEGTVGTIRNIAVVDGEKTNETENPIITYNKRVKQTEPLVEGDVIDYTISVNNTGEVDTIVKEVTDSIPEGTTYVENSASDNAIYRDGKLIWKDIAIAKGETAELTFKVKIDEMPEGIYSEKIPNIAIVDGDETNEVKNEVVKPHITRSKANNPTVETNLHEGDIITYTITAGNDGTKEKTIIIEDEAPQGTTLEEIVTTEGLMEKDGTNKIKWQVTLNPGDSKDFVFKVKVNQLEEGKYSLNIPNTAKVDGEDTNTVENNVVKPHITRSKANNPTVETKLHEGDIITYTITVGNDGTDSKTIIIEDEAPQGTTLEEIVTTEGLMQNDETNKIKWQVTLNPRDSKDFVFKVKVNQLEEGKYSLNIPNTAKVDGEDTNTVENNVVKPHITRNKANNPIVETKLHEGDIITYTITAGNDGTDSKTIIIEDEAPQGTTLEEIVTTEGLMQNDETNKIKWQVTLNPGDSKDFVFKVKVNQLEEGKYSLNIPNTAKVDGEDTNTVENNVVKPHITRSKANNPTVETNLHEGDIITYTITAGNDGTDSKTIIIEDEVPQGTTLEEIVTTEGLIEKDGTNKIKWQVTLNPGDSKDFVFKVKVNQLEEGKYSLNIPNTAKVDGEDTNTVENNVVKPHITRSKTNNPTVETNLHEGDIITYTITAGNDGTDSKTIIIEDEAPQGTTLEEIVTTEGLMENDGTNKIKWQVTLNPGDSKDFVFKVKVNTLANGVYGLNISNIAKVDGEDTNTVENNVVKPHITRRKESTPASGTKVKYDDTITYKIIVENDGTEAKEVIITDNIPEYTIFESVQNSGEQVKDSSGKTTGVKWVKTVPAKSNGVNGKVTVTFKVKVRGGADVTIRNTGYVDGNPTNEVTHPINKVVSVNASNNPGKNIVLVLDLSSSMLKVKRGSIDESQFYYGASEPIKDNNKYIYPVNKNNSEEYTQSNLAAAKKAVNAFAEKILTANSGNSITLVTFNYASYNKAIESIEAEASWYSDSRVADIKAHSEIKEFIGTKELITTSNITTFKNKVNSIRLRADYLCTNMVAALEQTKKTVTRLSSQGKDIDVVFFGDGKPSYNTETSAKVGFYSESQTNSKLKTLGEEIRKMANLYTLEYLVTEDATKTAQANTAFQKMTGVSSKDNKTRFSATTSDVINKLVNIASIIDAPISSTSTTDNKGIASVTIPSGLNLRISNYAKVSLYVDGKLNGQYSTIDQINASGKITYNAATETFKIDTTKFPAQSSINLKYYYKRQ